MKKKRILMTSDIHCTDLEDWYGVSNEERMERWLADVLAEHARHPFDLILIPGDISLDFHADRTPFDKGLSPSYLFMKMYATRLPAGVPLLVVPGNHDVFPEEIWQKKIVGNPRQCHAVLGDHTFIMLDNFRGPEDPTYDPAEEYTQSDVAYIQSVMEQHPQNHVWLLAHYFAPELESKEFKTLVAEDSRIKGLFMGHTHEHQLIPMGPEWGNKIIAQTGNYSFTMSGAANGGFWGFRDLVIEDDKAVSSYIMTGSDVILEEGPVHFDRWVNEIAEYQL